MIKKVADPWFESRSGNASLCPWERHFTLISHWGRAVYPLWWPSLTKDLQTEPKKMLYVGVVKQTQNAWFMRTLYTGQKKIEQNNFTKLSLLYRQKTPRTPC